MNGLCQTSRLLGRPSRTPNGGGTEPGSRIGVHLFLGALWSRIRVGSARAASSYALSSTRHTGSVRPRRSRTGPLMSARCSATSCSRSSRLSSRRLEAETNVRAPSLQRVLHARRDVHRVAPQVVQKALAADDPGDHRPRADPDPQMGRSLALPRFPRHSSGTSGFFVSTTTALSRRRP